MENRIDIGLWGREHHPVASPAEGLGWGLIAGFVGTMVMDLILMGAFSAAGRPAFTCFSIIGDTAARLFSKFGAEIAGGIPAGVAAHYLMGPIVGAVFGAAVVRIRAFRADTVRKRVILAVFYVEILSQPILAATPIFLKMTAFETFQWYSGSFIMHLIWGIVMGAVVGYGLRFENCRKSQMVENRF